MGFHLMSVGSNLLLIFLFCVPCKLQAPASDVDSFVDTAHVRLPMNPLSFMSSDLFLCLSGSWYFASVFISGSMKLRGGLAHLLRHLMVSLGASSILDGQVHLPLAYLYDQLGCSGSDPHNSVRKSCSLNIHLNQRASSINSWIIPEGKARKRCID